MAEAAGATPMEALALIREHPATADAFLAAAAARALPVPEEAGPSDIDAILSGETT